MLIGKLAWSLQSGSPSCPRLLLPLKYSSPARTKEGGGRSREQKMLWSMKNLVE